MNKTDRESCINTIKSLRSLALNIHGCIDAVDDQNCNKMIEILESEPHWIPVTENTLPEENRVVVVCGEKGTWDFGTYRGHGGNIHFWHWKKNTYKRVYWWMYKENALPKPYKEVTDGRD